MTTPSLKLRKLVDRAGQLLRKQTAAQNNYNEVREEIKEVIGADKDLMNAWIQAFTYEAQYGYDSSEIVNPIKFLKEVDSKKLRRKLLVVPITKARELLDKKLLKKISSIEEDEKPTLHIRQIDSERKEDKKSKKK